MGDVRVLGVHKGGLFKYGRSIGIRNKNTYCVHYKNDILIYLVLHSFKNVFIFLQA